MLSVSGAGPTNTSRFRSGGMSASVSTLVPSMTAATRWLPGRGRSVSAARSESEVIAGPAPTPVLRPRLCAVGRLRVRSSVRGLALCLADAAPERLADPRQRLGPPPDHDEDEDHDQDEEEVGRHARMVTRRERKSATDSGASARLAAQRNGDDEPRRGMRRRKRRDLVVDEPDGFGRVDHVDVAERRGLALARDDPDRT